MTEGTERPTSRDAGSRQPAGTYTLVRRIVVSLLGLSVLALGLALVVLPGPAFVVIPAGLAILALEFEWARRWLRRLEQRLREAVDSDAGRERAEAERGEDRGD